MEYFPWAINPLVYPKNVGKLGNPGDFMCTPRGFSNVAG